MNKTLGFQLVIYSLLLAGLSYLTHHLAPTLAQSTLITGLAGGAFCLTWGLRAVAGSRGKALPLLTLVPISYVMLSQTILTWGGRSQDVPGRQSAAVVMTVLLVLSIGMLMRIAYAGVVFDGEAVGPTKDGAAKSKSDGAPAAKAKTAERA